MKAILFGVLIILALTVPLPLLSFNSVEATSLTWSTKPGMPTPRAHLGSATGSDGKIYLIGGFGSNAEAGSKVEAFDPNNDTWTTKSNMPTPRDGMAIVATPNGKIYAIGGYGGNYVSTVEEYDVVSDTWTAKTSMPEARGYSGCALGPNGKIYIIGGSDSFGFHTNTVFEYDPTANSWATKAAMPTARTALGAGTINGKIYAIGGSTGGPDGDKADNEEYDPLTDTWTAKSPMPTARLYLGVVAADNQRIYAVGGITGTSVYLSTVEAYDPSTDVWVAETNLPTARVGLTTASVSGSIHAIGGLNGSGYLGTNEQAVVVNLNQPPSVDAGGPYYVNEGSSVVVAASGSDPDDDALTYAWDLDNNGTFETPGQNVSFFALGVNAPDSRTIDVKATDGGGLSATDQATINVIYNFTGFFAPLDNLPTLNRVNAGRPVAVKFSLSGDKGLTIFATAYPKSEALPCGSAALLNGIEPTVTSNFSYHQNPDQYTYTWKTDKAWEGTCRQLVVRLNDGTYHRANFSFK